MSDLDTEGCCPTCGRPTPRDYGQNRETDERAVEGALRVRFGEEYRKFFGGIEPPNWGAQRGHAIEVVRWLMRQCAGDVAKSINMARVLAANLFLERFLWEGRPRSWQAVNRDVARFFVAAAANPSRARQDARDAAARAERWARDAAMAAPADVAREALARLKGDSA
jgi:hypothetical protein